MEEWKKFTGNCQAVLIGCSSKKLLSSGMAKDMYGGALFKKSIQLRELLFPKLPWFILSARYGLLHPETRIGVYDESLIRFTTRDLIAWSNRVSNDLLNMGLSYFACFAGTIYYKHLKVNIVPIIPPLSIGKQLQWLNFQIDLLNNKMRGLNLYEKK